MAKRSDIRLGIYEKAMPNDLTWVEKLELVRKTGYDFLEISIDETDFRLNRLNNPKELLNIKKAIDLTKVPIHSLCLSGHRRYPLGSLDENKQMKSLEIMENSLIFANEIGVQRIQLAGYDVYYEESNELTKITFLENLKKCVNLASKYGVVLGFETMETDFMNTVTKAMQYVTEVNSPYLQIYPDLGNLYNGNKSEEDVFRDILIGEGHFIAVHLKETVKDIFRDMQFGQGRVDFKRGIDIFYKTGVRIFNCEIWDDKSGNYISNMKNCIDVITKNLE